MVILLGLTGGNALKPCFMCDFNSRSSHEIKYGVKTVYKRRTEYVIGKDNVRYNPIVDPSKIIIPPLHIKLGLFKNFIKSLGEKAIRFLMELFPKLSPEKVEEGVLNGPDIRSLIQSKDFVKRLTAKERNAFKALCDYTLGFLGNYRASNYKRLAQNLKKTFRILGVHMSVKIHYAVDHVDDFASNCGAFSDEQGERVHQDIKEIQRRYKGHDCLAILTDYAWSLKREGRYYGREPRKSLHF